MRMKCTIPSSVLERWYAYEAENPAWSFDDLVTQLLRQHFNEADSMKESIKEQEQKKRGEE